jgi:hypothetical protein
VVWMWCGCGVDVVWMWCGCGVDVVHPDIIFRSMRQVSMFWD